MTSAYTYTRTKTYARIVLLKEQVRTILRRTTQISQETLHRLMIGVDNHWIANFLVYGFDQKNLCRAELVFEIDWDEFQLQISHGRTTVTIDQRWENDTAIEVDEVIRLFNEFSQECNLRTEWMVRYRSWVYSDSNKLQEVQRVLGLTTAPKIRWAGMRQGTSHQIPELPEARVGCYITDT